MSIYQVKIKDTVPNARGDMTIRRTNNTLLLTCSRGVLLIERNRVIEIPLENICYMEHKPEGELPALSFEVPEFVNEIIQPSKRGKTQKSE